MASQGEKRERPSLSMSVSPHPKAEERKVADIDILTGALEKVLDALDISE